MPAAAMLPKRFAKDVRRAGKRGCDIAIGNIEFGQQIVGCVAVNGGRGFLQRRARIRDGGEDVIFDIHQCRRVFGDVAAVGHHDGHRLADMDDLVLCQNGAVDILPVAGTGKPHDQAVGFEMRCEICRGENAEHAGNGQGVGFVDP